ncbi:ABC transporter [Bacillus sp. FJAT-27225]|uniref:siderophore ABC transporter substrate-binding protein n=1 Tax=Bacillus sp. FJAT-27225 TaxID=1743144 RepID=UPI00080C24C6|nr:siderophore ABC transporter substrate-binding protein [Bacillus sp. FJAT-27225]OCA83299.1 ABC transporter [Bacillus sp. FJAT-27225]
MKNLVLPLLLAAMMIVVAACGAEDSNKSGDSSKNSEELTIKHQLGETNVKKNPETVIVFDYGVLDTLDQLGVKVTGLPQETVPGYLEKYKGSEYQNVGGIKEPDFEKINELGPDLIIISGRQQDAYEELSEIAPTIFLGLDTSKYLESFKENTKTLGKIFEKEAEVEEKLAGIQKTIDSLNEKGKATGKNGLIVLASEGSLSAYGPGSRFGIIHDNFGIEPVDKNIEVSTHGQTISFEYILEKDPDYLFVIDRGAVVQEGGSSAKPLIENELVKKTNAYKNDNIVYLNPDYWYMSGGGLVSVAEMAKEIEEGIN